MEIIQSIVTPQIASVFPVVGAGTLTFQGTVHMYHLLDTQSHIKLATICNHGTLAISSTYPSEYRLLGLLHELIEFGSPHPKYRKRQCSCLKALLQEIEMAKNQGLDIDEYLKFRLEFFQGLVNYYSSQNHLEGEDAEILEHTTKTLSHLKSLVL